MENIFANVLRRQPGANMQLAQQIIAQRAAAQKREEANEIVEEEKTKMTLKKICEECPKTQEVYDYFEERVDDINEKAEEEDLII